MSDNKTAKECLFCDRVATFKIDGWAEDGQDGGYVYQTACDEHIKSYREWRDEYSSQKIWEPDDRIHGLEYIESIEQITDETVFDDGEWAKR